MEKNIDQSRYTSSFGLVYNLRRKRLEETRGLSESDTDPILRGRGEYGPGTILAAGTLACLAIVLTYLTLN